MITVLKQHEPVAQNAILLDVQLRLLAPRLVSYQCDLEPVVQCIEADENCSQAILRYANRRHQDPEADIETVHHAIVYLGMIDAKHFLIYHLLMDPERCNRAQQLQLLIRAKLCTEMFETSGPVNKDIAYVSAFVAHKKLLKTRNIEAVFNTFRLSNDRRDAIRHWNFGLRQCIEQAIVIETRCNPGSAQRRRMPRHVERLYHDALYWANCIVMSH